MNKVLKTVLQDVAIIHWPNGGTDVGPPVAQLACHMPTVPLTLAQRWPNSGMPLLGQHWPTGHNDVGPPVAANGGPMVEPPVAQRWSTGGPTVACHVQLGQRWPTGQNDVGPPVAADGGPTLGHRGRAIWIAPLAPITLNRASHSNLVFYVKLPRGLYRHCMV